MCYFGWCQIGLCNTPRTKRDGTYSLEWRSPFLYGYNCYVKVYWMTVRCISISKSKKKAVIYPEYKRLPHVYCAILTILCSTRSCVIAWNVWPTLIVKTWCLDGLVRYRSSHSFKSPGPVCAHRPTVYHALPLIWPSGASFNRARISCPYSIELIHNAQAQGMFSKKQFSFRHMNIILRCVHICLVTSAEVGVLVYYGKSCQRSLRKKSST